jgi:hypothetical protein
VVSLVTLSLRLWYLMISLIMPQSPMSVAMFQRSWNSLISLMSRCLNQAGMGGASSRLASSLYWKSGWV